MLSPGVTRLSKDATLTCDTLRLSKDSRHTDTRAKRYGVKGLTSHGHSCETQRLLTDSPHTTICVRHYK